MTLKDSGEPEPEDTVGYLLFVDNPCILRLCGLSYPASERANTDHLRLPMAAWSLENSMPVLPLGLAAIKDVM